jgi:hypothetical protein
MLEYVTTLLAALIGAVMGSVGAVLTGHLLTRRAEERHRREALVQRYLFQLQDAVEALWYRLDNLALHDGRYVMVNAYFETTTLFALGKVLAVGRIMALDGAYPQLEAAYPKLVGFLKEHQRRIDRELQGVGFYQYDRVSLAEAIIEREGEQFRISTYLEFRRRYEAEGSPENKWLTPAKEAIERLHPQRMEALLKSLHMIAIRIAGETGVSSSLPT